MQIGGRQVVHAGVYHVPDGDSMEFGCNLPDGDVLNLRIVFTEDLTETSDKSEKSPKVGLDYELAEDGRKINVALLDFKNFDGVLGQGLRSPLVLAQAEGGQLITFLGTIYRFEGLRKIELQVMYGAEQ